jgi:hypothetical protein
MVTFTVTLSDAEAKALGYAAVDPQDWIDNVVHERCRVAIEEIVASEVQRLLAAGQSITGSKDDIVLAAPIKTAAQKMAEQANT